MKWKLAEVPGRFRPNLLVSSQECKNGLCGALSGVIGGLLNGFSHFPGIHQQVKVSRASVPYCYLSIAWSLCIFVKS